MPNKVYDVLKWIALVALDAIGAAYYGLSVIWQFPFGEQVMATCTTLSVFLGTIIGVSSARYQKEQG